MSAPIEATIADQQGLSVPRLISVIEEHYVTPKGRSVRVKRGRGVYTDGVPTNVLRLVDRDA